MCFKWSTFAILLFSVGIILWQYSSHLIFLRSDIKCVVIIFHWVQLCRSWRIARYVIWLTWYKSCYLARKWMLGGYLRKLLQWQECHFKSSINWRAVILLFLSFIMLGRALLLVKRSRRNNIVIAEIMNIWNSYTCISEIHISLFLPAPSWLVSSIG